MKEYNYTNMLGYHKKLVVSDAPNKEGKYSCTLWSNTTGDYCGSGEMTAEELDELLSHYGLHFEGD